MLLLKVEFKMFPYKMYYIRVLSSQQLKKNSDQNQYWAKEVVRSASVGCNLRGHAM